MEKDYGNTVDRFCDELNALADRGVGIQHALLYLQQKGMRLRRGHETSYEEWRAEGRFGDDRARVFVEQRKVPARELLPAYAKSASDILIDTVAVYGEIGSTPVRKAWPVGDSRINKRLGTNLGDRVQGCWAP